MSKILAVWFTAAMCLTVAAVHAADAAPDANVHSPFNGKDLAGWNLKGKGKSKWVVGRAVANPADLAKFEVTPIPADDKEASAPQLINAEHGGVDLFTEAKYGDCTLELEFMLPKGSNSGVYLMGEYEVQILDSYGKEKPEPSDLGGLYGAAAPKVNAAKKPGEWQKFVIEFQAPRFAGDKKTANAKFVKVTLNDQVIHENVEMATFTPGGVAGKEAPTGPLMFQGNHGPVAFRNIKITTKPAK